MELKVGMKAIIVNSQHHAEYNFQICEIKEIENSKRIYVELHSNKLTTNFYVHANELIPLIYENPDDLKKYGTTVEYISKLFTEYKGYYDVICKVAEDISHESEEKEEEYNKQIEEMQHHIDSLEADKRELRARCKESARDNFDNHLYGLLNIVGREDLHPKLELPTEPIKVAEMLIYATETYETSSLAKMFGAGDMDTYKLYSNADLRQIAEHLLVYCNNSEGD